MRKTVVEPGTACAVEDGGSLFFQPRLFYSEYTFGESVGSGTSAVVRRAVRITDSEPVAVKCVQSGDDEVHTFAREEYDLLLTLRHPSVIRVHGLFANSQYSLLVMDLCESSVQSRVDAEGPCGEEMSRVLFRQLLEATGYIHERRVVHRDVKPDNLLLGHGGRTLHLTDFNSAMRVGAGQLLLSARGTHHYSAPELLARRSWNERVDVWACGLCLFFLLYAALPFDCTEEDVLDAFREGRLPPIAWHEDPSHEAQLLQNLSLQCLAVEMRDRPPALELLQHSLFAEPQLLARRSNPERRRSSIEEAPRRLRSAPTMCAATGQDSAACTAQCSEAMRQLQASKLARAGFGAIAPSRSALAA